MGQNTHVSVNLEQDFSNTQKSTARNNIAAASSTSLSTLSNVVSNLSSKVSGIESAIAPAFAEATVNYADTSVPLIGDMNRLKVYCYISSTTSCQIKVMPSDDRLKIKAFRAITYTLKESLDTLRHSLPFDEPLSEGYSGHIFYDADSFGSVDIDVVLTDESTVHLTAWYKCDTDITSYRLYLVEEVRI